MTPIIHESLEDIYLMDTIDDVYRKKYFTYYDFEGKGVPRVSNILKECIGKESLMMWAATVGKQEMMRIKNQATTVGSYVHEMIENFLLTGNDLDISYKVPHAYILEINMAYSNFKKWISYINSKGYVVEEIIATEYRISCPYYGGTIDCIMKINGKNYIVDFKTSKSISHEYIMQIASYMWIVNNGFCSELPHIDGIGIIRIDKEKDVFEDLFLNEADPRQNMIINNYMRGFGVLVNSYYHNINMRRLFTQYKKEYKIENAILKGE